MYVQYYNGIFSEMNRKVFSTGFKLIYVTVPTTELGSIIARTLVEEKLAACVNVLNSGMESYYMWDGKLEHNSEVLLLAKTVGENVDKVIDRVKSLHTYDTPCAISIPIEDGYPAFLHWIKDSVEVKS